METNDELRGRFSSTCDWLSKKALANYYSEYVFLAISVIATASATISVAAGTLTKEINAILAALPGITLLITKTFQFESRSNWWWKRYQVYDSLYRELKYEGVKAEEVSKKITSIQENTEINGCVLTSRN